MTTCFVFCSITCETGTKQASIITDRVSINFGHLQENIFSQDFFNFVVSIICLHLALPNTHFHLEKFQFLTLSSLHRLQL